MCTATEAKTLQQVHRGYNSFFRKVIPVKRVQKPVHWYTRLTVYGNPGRVVNGCAPEITHLFGAFEMEIAGRRSSSFLQGTRPHFASGTLMSLRTTPPLHATHQAGARGSYTLRKRHQGTLSGALRSEARRERSTREGGFPCRSGGRV